MVFFDKKIELSRLKLIFRVFGACRMCSFKFAPTNCRKWAHAESSISILLVAAENGKIII